MNLPAKIIIAALSAGLAYDAYVAEQNKRLYRKELKTAWDLAEYLASKLDDNNVAFDEFDRIVVKTL